MKEREKVIEGLETMREFFGFGLPSQSPVFEAYQNILTDALALLKEQEAVEPILIREGRNKYYNDYVCPRCDNEVVYEQNYCSECGVQFLWEGR